MAREKEKVNCINKDTELQIKKSFPKLMEFYSLANLAMSTQEFYSIMRGEEGHPDSVAQVELGYLKAVEVKNMTFEELCEVLANNVVHIEAGADRGVVEAIRLIVARLV